MLTTYRKQIIEKIIEKDGIVFKVFFLISNDGGKVKARFIKAVPIGNIDELTETIKLADTSTKKFVTFAEKKVRPISTISPYTNLIFVNGSKPRAPTK